MLLKNTLTYLLIIATINLIFCVPQQNDSANILFKQYESTFENSNEAEGEIQSVFELICEVVFDTDITLPVEEEAAILEKDFLGKRVNRTFIRIFSQLFLLNILYNNLIESLSPKFLNYQNSSETTSSGYSFIFRLTPF